MHYTSQVFGLRVYLSLHLLLIYDSSRYYMDLNNPIYMNHYCRYNNWVLYAGNGFTISLPNCFV